MMIVRGERAARKITHGATQSLLISIIISELATSDPIIEICMRYLGDI